MSKINTKETKPKQVNGAKTVENIASWYSDFVYRDLQLEN